MAERAAPGLSADWLNAWLAAIGATVLNDRVRLRWSDGRRPHAILGLDDGSDVAEAIAERWPSRRAVDNLVIANGGGQFPRQVSLDAYIAAVTRNRLQPDDFSLSCSVTDLVRELPKGIPHGPFDPSAPKGSTLWDRLTACLDEVPTDTPELSKRVAQTLDGRAARTSTNGLGFDVRRISGTLSGGVYVDPVVEVLAFFGLALFPVRGDGIRTTAARGWHRFREQTAPGVTGGRWKSSFVWPVWTDCLDRWAIDALLAEFHSAGPNLARRRRLQVLGVSRSFEAVPFQKRGDMDMTAGFASRPFHG